jgi:hypothetical protein
MGFSENGFESIGEYLPIVLVLIILIYECHVQQAAPPTNGPFLPPHTV